jgi:hypothetical protein
LEPFPVQRAGICRCVRQPVWDRRQRDIARWRARRRFVSGGVLYVNWQGDSFKTGDTVTVAFGAPEPSTWAMMLLGFAGLGYAGYRGRRSAVAGAL